MTPRTGAPGKSTDEIALEQHRAYRGKVQMMPKCPLRSFDDFAIWYTPGVAAASRAIAADRDLAYETGATRLPSSRMEAAC